MPNPEEDTNDFLEVSMEKFNKNYHYIKDDETVNDIEDFKDVYESYKYWKLDNIPLSLYICNEK